MFGKETRRGIPARRAPAGRGGMRGGAEGESPARGTEGRGRPAAPGRPREEREPQLLAGQVRSGDLGFHEGHREGGGDAATYNTRGRVYFEKGRYEDALADASRAIELGPRYDAAWNTRGYILYTLRRYEEALRDLDRALGINPRHEGAYNHRGLVHTAMERYDRALADFDEALKVDPDYREVYANKAEAYERNGSKREAVEAYREFLRRASSHGEARRAERARERIRILTAE